MLSGRHDTTDDKEVVASVTLTTGPTASSCTCNKSARPVGTGTPPVFTGDYNTVPRRGEPICMQGGISVTNAQRTTS